MVIFAYQFIAGVTADITKCFVHAGDVALPVGGGNNAKQIKGTHQCIVGTQGGLKLTLIAFALSNVRLDSHEAADATLSIVYGLNINIEPIFVTVFMSVQHFPLKTFTTVQRLSHLRNHQRVCGLALQHAGRFA